MSAYMHILTCNTQCGYMYTDVCKHAHTQYINAHVLTHMRMCTHGGIPVQQRVRRHISVTKLRQDTQC